MVNGPRRLALPVPVPGLTLGLALALALTETAAASTQAPIIKAGRVPNVQLAPEVPSNAGNLELA